MTLYNEIGFGYNTTRNADPFITGRIYEHLSPVPHRVYLDIGCGTGNYLGALTEKGLSFYGIDPSVTMLQQAKIKNQQTEFIEATAENIPLPGNFFDGAIAILTLHHWNNILEGLKEVNRVLKPGSRLVIFSFTPEQIRGYWLHHYFPQMIEKCMKVIPGSEKMQQLLHDSGFTKIEMEKYFIRDGLKDHFLYSYKHSPEMYLSEQVRNNTSGFRVNATEEELKQGLMLLEKDIQSGEINNIILKYDNDLGDYMFFIAAKS